VPEVIAASGVTFHTSDTIMRLEHLPERLVILGGGFVAAEFAHVFTAFGVPVTVVTRHDLLRHHDRDVRTRLTDLVRDRWDLRTGATVTSATEHDGEVRLGLDGGTEVGGDVLLVATGRTPNSDRLDLAAGGVLTHPDGRIVVDEYQRTTAAGVWALGDASTEHRLKHVANHEARTVAHNLLHPDDPIASDHRFVPGAVFTHPQIATVGATEAELVETGRRYVGAVVGYDQIAGGWAMEDTTGFCKLLADPESGRLLGAHLMGPQASILIQPLIQAMSFGLGVREMARGQYWIHPALTEVVENALLALHLS
ncbi:MAG: FAD-dependent oxidoreductase, partial [Actinobacteria bacterium]|nr:FAD-dependent oxidoreductase [Actinomycetota bacterium]